MRMFRNKSSDAQTYRYVYVCQWGGGWHSVLFLNWSIVGLLMGKGNRSDPMDPPVGEPRTRDVVSPSVAKADSRKIPVCVLTSDYERSSSSVYFWKCWTGRNWNSESWNESNAFWIVMNFIVDTPTNRPTACWAPLCLAIVMSVNHAIRPYTPVGMNAVFSIAVYLKSFQCLRHQFINCVNWNEKDENVWHGQAI